MTKDKELPTSIATALEMLAEVPPAGTLIPNDLIQRVLEGRLDWSSDRGWHHPGMVPAKVVAQGHVWGCPITWERLEELRSEK